MFDPHWAYVYTPQHPNLPPHPSWGMPGSQFFSFPDLPSRTPTHLTPSPMGRPNTPTITPIEAELAKLRAEEEAAQARERVLRTERAARIAELESLMRRQ